LLSDRSRLLGTVFISFRLAAFEEADVHPNLVAFRSTDAASKNNTLAECTAATWLQVNRGFWLRDTAIETIAIRHFSPLSRGERTGTSDVR
jgi:hypothetical protein